MLVGRAGELAAIAACLVNGRPVAVVGEAGIGKTALLREAARRSGRRIFEGGGLATLSRMRYLPLMRALDCSIPDGSRKTVTNWIVGSIGGGVLFLDDLQWADPGTIGLLGLLASRVSLLLSIRRETPDRGAKAVAEKAGCKLLVLGGLPEAEAEALVRSRRPDLPAQAVRGIVRTARGKPLVLEQLVIDPELPKTLRLSSDVWTAVARRTTFRKLTLREREVLILVGQGLTSREIARWLGISPLTVNSEVQAGRDKLGAKTRAQAALLLSTLYSTHASDSNRWN